MQNFVLPETPQAQRQAYTPALIALAVLYFMMGLITCLNDTLVPFFRSGFKLSYAQSSLVQFYFFLTYGAMSIPAGKIVEKVGYKNGMVLGFSIAAAGAFLFMPASAYHQYGLFLAALFVLAIGIVVLQVAANPYVTVLGPSRTASSRLTLIQGVGSVGTTVAPLLGAFLILSRLKEAHSSSAALRFPYAGIACLLALIAWVVYRLRLPSLQTPAAQGKTGNGRHGVFSYRNLNFGIAGIFLYVGAEVAIGTFLTNYISDTLSIDVHQANRFVAFYWGGMLVGRLAGAALLRSVSPPAVLRACTCLAILLIVLSVSTSGYVAVWSMIAVGLCNSVMFATIFSLSVMGLGEYTTRASGLLSTAIAGGAVISFLMGILKDNSTWTVAFLLPMFCYSYILLYGISGYKSKAGHSK